MSNTEERINQEWITLNAIRGMTKIASKGSMTKSTYDNALDLGGALYPDLLGPENSLLKRDRESDTTKEYRQKAELKSIRDGYNISALDLVLTDIEDYESLIATAQINKDEKRIDQLKRRLAQLNTAKKELDMDAHSENQLIFRDAYNVDRDLPELSKGHAHRDLQLPDGNYLRLRVLHPEKTEYITGADIIYERHNNETGTVSIVIVQYKIWTDKKLYLSDDRMKCQIEKMRAFVCNKEICQQNSEKEYRFPCCSGFIRPTDKLQKSDQKFISSGEHLPICQIEKCKSKGPQGADILEYERIKDTSLSSELFEHLFNRGKIGSRNLTYQELKELYADAAIINAHDTVVIYAQEF
ncbi:hypothetical protein [Aeromonas dhakensis]|uniref:hypothetical protein n=1 Tax=Aeromonas dhakensis TaxID=196024 RepID=UPI002D7753E3|nr:hypothetical protein [Aeromonas dhakensis]WRT72387.1 hypothetical protein VK677_18975 [Aeromonas dhakensis]